MPGSSSGVTPGTLSASGIEQVRGGGYNDTLLGGGRVNTDGAATTVSGDASFEGFRGFGGNDLINGRTGFDRAEYNVGNQTEGIVVNLAAGTVSGDPLLTGNDTLRGIESINSTFLDDRYVATGFTLSNAAAPSANSGDVIVTHAGRRSAGVDGLQRVPRLRRQRHRHRQWRHASQLHGHPGREPQRHCR